MYLLTSNIKRSALLNGSPEDQGGDARYPPRQSLFIYLFKASANVITVLFLPLCSDAVLEFQFLNTS